MDEYSACDRMIRPVRLNSLTSQHRCHDAIACSGVNTTRRSKEWLLIKPFKMLRNSLMVLTSPWKNFLGHPYFTDLWNKSNIYSKISKLCVPNYFASLSANDDHFMLSVSTSCGIPPKYVKAYSVPDCANHNGF